MFDPKMLDDLARRFANSLPSGVRHLQEDMEKNFRVVLQNALAKMDLVNREEFEVQSAVLARTRAKIDVLERKVAELERRLQENES